MRVPIILPLLLAAPGLVHADFHFISIREVYTGPADDPSAQYVMLQMYNSGQNIVGGHSLEVYDASGVAVATYTFGGDVANGASQSFIWIATPEAEARFGLAADLSMAATLPPDGGKVCFENVDCFSWGGFAGSATTPSPSGNPYNPDTGLSPGVAARRDISGGTDPTRLDSRDDTDDSQADFESSTPQPANNATPPPGAGGGGTGGGGSGGGETTGGDTGYGGAGGRSGGGGYGGGATTGIGLLLVAGLWRRLRGGGIRPAPGRS